MLWGTIVYLFCLISYTYGARIVYLAWGTKVPATRWLGGAFGRHLPRHLRACVTSSRNAPSNGGSFCRAATRSMCAHTTSEVRTNAVKFEQNVSLKLAPWAGGKDARTVRPQLRCASIHTYDVSG
jgi:hypothetical protein